MIFTDLFVNSFIKCRSSNFNASRIFETTAKFKLIKSVVFEWTVRKDSLINAEYFEHIINIWKTNLIQPAFSMDLSEELSIILNGENNKKNSS